MNNPSFKHFDWTNGELFDDSQSQHPSRLFALMGPNTFHFNQGSTYYIYCYKGYAYIDAIYPLLKHHYASCVAPKNEYIHGSEECQAIIIERIGTTGVFQLGGPVEKEGRLKYIDGCTDSLLLAPWKYGEPCLNHLHFPFGIDQTPHTHPSIRMGIVASGYGACITPFGDIPLQQGMIFAILPKAIDAKLIPGIDGKEYPEGTHSFSTRNTSMDVIAFHPDSDFGPRDKEHPMINRTIVDGVSAKLIPEIQTK